MLGDDSRRCNLIEAGDEDPLKPKVYCPVIKRLHIGKKTPYTTPVECGVPFEKIEGERNIPRREGLSIRPEDTITCGDPEYSIVLAPFVGDGKPGNLFSANAIEHEEGLIDPGLCRPPRSCRRREWIEVPNPGSLLFLRNHQHPFGRSWNLSDAP